MWMRISAVMKKEQVRVLVELCRYRTSYPSRRKTHSPTRLEMPVPRHLVHYPSNTALSSQGHGTRSRPGLQSQHVCDGVKYVLNKSQVFPPGLRPALSIRQLATPNAPLLGIECFHRGISLHPKGAILGPLWPQNHWPPCVPLITLSLSYCTCRSTNLRLTNTSINHLSDLNCCLVFSTHSLNLALGRILFGGDFKQL